MNLEYEYIQYSNKQELEHLVMDNHCCGPFYADQDANYLTRQDYRGSVLNSYAVIHLFIYFTLYLRISPLKDIMLLNIFT